MVVVKLLHRKVGETMYRFKTELVEKLFEGRIKCHIARKVGITDGFFSSILTGKRGCSKMTAHCITKAINENSEIQDYFRIGE